MRHWHPLAGVHPRLRVITAVARLMALAQYLALLTVAVRVVWLGPEETAPSIAASDIGHDGMTWMWVLLLAVGSALGIAGLFLDRGMWEVVGNMLHAGGMLVWAVTAVTSPATSASPTIALAFLACCALAAYHAVVVRAASVIAQYGTAVLTIPPPPPSPAPPSPRTTPTPPAGVG